MNRNRVPTLLLVAMLVATVALTGPPVAAAPDPNLPGPGTLRLEVIGAGFDRGDAVPFAPASFVVRDTLSGATLATPDVTQLVAPGGGACPGVGTGVLCTGAVPLTVLTQGTPLHISVGQGPADRLAVYSGDCDGGATVQNATFGAVRLAVDELKVCRVTFVRPDSGAATDRDTGLLVRTTFDVDQIGLGRPNQELDLRGGSTSIASTTMEQLTDVTNPTARCPLTASRPECEWAVAFDQDDYALPFRIQESAHPDWLPVFGGACGPRGELPVDHPLSGELVRCSIENVHLERSDGAGRNAVVRVEVVGPAGAGSPTAAQVTVRSSAGDPLVDLSSAQMLTATGSPCATVAGSLCTGDVGVTTEPERGALTERFTIHLAPSASGFLPTFSGGCTNQAPQTGPAFGTIDLGVGGLVTCRVTLVPPPSPLPVLTVGDVRVVEGNVGTVPVGVRIGLSAATSQTVTVSASTAIGTATAPADFTSVATIATIPAGQTSTVVSVPIVGDILGEPDETFTLRLATPTGATIGDGTAVVTIANDDDRTPPVLAAKATVTVESRVAPVKVLYTAPTATDLVDGRVTVTCVATSGTAFVMGTTTVTCRAVDRNGNAATSSFSVLVRLPTTSGAVTGPGSHHTDPLQDVRSRQPVQVDAGGFDPGSEVELVFITDDGQQISLGRTRAGRDGRFDRVVLVPVVPPGAGQMTALGTAADGAAMVRAWHLTVVG